ncbi:iron-containing alcohol dehydrogenase [Lactonifactor sp. BIOML-A3]|uniref:iron-containing alcohol dehydrogenase n=1 Tax=unclassified Lactonifactor TaxID=2636670 RepID=UPI0012B07324|nr:MULTISPECIES: iron-containing alcohol dehydrogenase [unclassified Lactonifactor]MSA02055.1 iron-containing alcohol dehydrogenase [Lactonifactor sp. BIOML-A5]MSA10564.1 iron-containing alcohol dehydrogenase [Lactonifactor sp. BIOML-A4]MSA13231.1 iron-containing alcohol dehydrogenase [Lactonifactor sp. BIOML-A3]MSA17636.1 iron-containing alcohol dehydrogenase [Lactonifactor sp. BIOML-A2]MSA38111.1 iron-containing alcohol dehydrogenase [Lactonifactor sp. BIOML-A1]
MIPEYYEFQSSAKILSGAFALENIPVELDNLGCLRPLILSDQMLEKIGTLQVVLDALLSGGTEIGGIYTDIPADSSLEIVNRIGSYYKENNCDGIVAVGGGSVIDTAKGARMILSQHAVDIMEILGCESMKRGEQIPFVAIPTTSGTGSESTLVAVIRNEARKLKMEFISYYLQPDAAVLDVRMTETLPPRMTASTGMDALCHAIEAYSCLQKNPLSDAYAISAVKMIGTYLEEAVANGKNKEARLAMANASMMAGAAFSNSMVGIVHAVGHALGGVCHIPHGDAMTVLLPYGMEYNLEKCRKEYGELLLYLAGDNLYSRTPAAERAEQLIREIRNMENRLHNACGLPLTLKELGVKTEDFLQAANTAVNDGAMIVNPRQAGVEDVLELLKQAY